MVAGGARFMRLFSRRAAATLAVQPSLAARAAARGSSCRADNFGRQGRAPLGEVDGVVDILRFRGNFPGQIDHQHLVGGPLVTESPD
jgi:hypothetical protein